MEKKYKIIKSTKQYEEYCNELENMVLEKGEIYADDIELLTLLIEKWVKKIYHKKNRIRYN